MIAFARAHKTALWAEFIVIVLSVTALFVASHLGLVATEDSLGWMLLYGALPWSLAAAAVPDVIGMVMIALGLGFNMVVVTIVVGYALAWWLKTLRYDNDG